jgi:hypothetical protein
MRLDDLKDVIQEMIKENDIKVVRKRFKSPAGRAWVHSKTIKIPSIVDFQSAGTAIHEIAHIILGHDDEVLDYICEYETEKWTINFLKKCNMHIDYKSEFEMYIEGAKLNVDMHIKRQMAKDLKKGRKSRIRKKILKWVEDIEQNI